MSQPIRQSNLFSAEDFTKIFSSFKHVNFTAYDYDSIRAALVEYVRQQFPEDFNDYIESSEFIAIIELLAYLGTSLAFRTELNSRENFLDTAERRESIIRLARMLSYSPRRNIPLRGQFKIYGVQTNETVKDSLGRNLKDTTVFWNDANNADSFEQFITVLNASFIQNNTFGRPYKSGTIGDVATDLYQLNNAGLSNIVYPVALQLPDGRVNIDVVNPDFIDGETFEERAPAAANAMHLIYRNDGNGLDSTDTGFFLHFRQGTLGREDFRFDVPIENRVIDINHVNINELDVVVEEIDTDGNVIDLWTKVPNVSGSNIFFNDLALDVRKIYSVITGTNDTIQIKFADGNFGEIPRGLFRVWYRTSAGSFLTLRPENANNLQLTIPYVGRDSKKYSLVLFFGLAKTVNNAAPAETDEDIKARAPQVFYTQNRMVNSEDYNVFPLNRGNEIEKVRAINRTHAGHSRFIDINDPTGSNQNVILFAEDGVLYKEDEPERLEVDMTNIVDFEEFVEDVIEPLLENQRLNNWFYDVYLTDFNRQNPDELDFTDFDIRWKTLPERAKNDTGFFLADGTTIPQDAEDYLDDGLALSSDSFRYIAPGAFIRFSNPDNPQEIVTTSVKGVANTGLPASSSITSIGPVELSREIHDLWQLVDALPAFRIELTSDEIDDIVAQIELQNDFALGYNATEDRWYVIPAGSYNLTDEFDLDSAETINDTSWILHADYLSPAVSGSVAKYVFTTRGTRYIFGSDKEVRFFYSPEQRVIDIETGLSLQDEIVILDINECNETEEWDYDATGLTWDLDAMAIPAASLYIPLKYRDLSVDDFVVQHLDADDVSYGTAHYTYSLGRLVISGSYTPVAGDRFVISYRNTVKLDRDVIWNIDRSVILEDGHLDQTKVEIKPYDYNEDGVPDAPLSFYDIVDVNVDRVFFETYTDFDGYQYTRPWKTVYVEVELDSVIDENTLTVDGTLISETGIYLFNTQDELDYFIETVEDVVVTEEQTALALELKDKIAFVRSTSTFYIIPLIRDASSLLSGEENMDYFVETTEYSVAIGKSFTLNEDEDFEPFWFKWKHYAPRDNRIDPSISNIIDMFVLTKTYNNDILLWKDAGKEIGEIPEYPTTEELRVQFGELNQYKMISDEIVFKSAEFKVLFGKQAAPELRAKFKVVKIPSISISDNEIKSRVIQAIDEFFNIQNWDFGESFFYTELSAYIHRRMASSISSIVIVPTKEESQFGNLFQIKGEPNELFLSTATVADVEIVQNLTDVNLRTK